MDNIAEILGEKNSDSKAVEPKLEEVVYTRKKTSTHKGKKDNLSTLERVVIEHKLDDAEAVCILGEGETLLWELVRNRCWEDLLLHPCIQGD